MTDSSSRLEKIREILHPEDGRPLCLCSSCVAGRELLAVVDAERGNKSPSVLAGNAKRNAERLENNPKIAAEYPPGSIALYRTKADTWDTIS
jgi:hypothetical protein